MDQKKDSGWQKGYQSITQDVASLKADLAFERAAKKRLAALRRKEQKIAANVRNLEERLKAAQERDVALQSETLDQIKAKYSRIEELDKIASELARCVFFALKYMDMRHKGALMYKVNADGQTEMLHWIDDFSAALKLAGIEVNREKLESFRSSKARKVLR